MNTARLLSPHTNRKGGTDVQGQFETITSLSPFHSTALAVQCRASPTQPPRLTSPGWTEKPLGSVMSLGPSAENSPSHPVEGWTCFLVSRKELLWMMETPPPSPTLAGAGMNMGNPTGVRSYEDLVWSSFPKADIRCGPVLTSTHGIFNDNWESCIYTKSLSSIRFTWAGTGQDQCFSTLGPQVLLDSTSHHPQPD